MSVASPVRPPSPAHADDDPGSAATPGPAPAPLSLDPEEAERLTGLLALVSDPVRLRVLFALAGDTERCVGDLARTLGVSLDQSSYALRHLRTAGLVRARRQGRAIHYRLAEGFPHALLDHCLRQLLSIAGAPGSAPRGAGASAVDR